MNPSFGDGERAASLDDVVEVLSNGRGLSRCHIRVDFPKILRALSREMPHERTNSNHCGNTSPPRSSTTFQPRLRYSPLLPSSTDSARHCLCFSNLGFRLLTITTPRARRGTGYNLKPFIHNSWVGARVTHVDFTTIRLFCFEID